MHFQKKYILKFATDGAVLTKTKNAVQGTMKLIPADEHGKVWLEADVADYLEKEITLYYYIGTFIFIHENDVNLYFKPFESQTPKI